MASLAGTTVVVLLGWTLWTFSGTGVWDASPPEVAVPAPNRPASAEPELPVAGDGATPQPRQAELSDGSPAEPPGPPGPDGVLGRVTNASTGEPVEAFQVHVVPASPEDVWERLSTSVSHPFRRRTGVFLVDVEPGSWDVVVQAPGFQPAVQLAVDVPAATARPVEFALQRGPGIVGTVVDENGMYPAGIKAFLHVVELRDPEAVPPRIRVTETGPDGRFSFSPLPSGEYAVSLLELENKIDRHPAIRVDGGTTNIEMYLSPRHQLTYQVQDAHGLPVRGVLVELRGGVHYSRGRTNESGTVLFEYVPDGTYEVKASARGYEELTQELELVGTVGAEVRWLQLRSTSEG
jgi:hypothetical protein